MPWKRGLLLHYKKGKYSPGRPFSDTMNSILQSLDSRGSSVTELGHWEKMGKNMSFIHLLSKHLCCLLWLKWNAWAECWWKDQPDNRKQRWEVHTETNGRGPKTLGRSFQIGSKYGYTCLWEMPITHTQVYIYICTIAISLKKEIWNYSKILQVSNNCYQW